MQMTQNYAETAKKARKEVLNMIFRAQTSHIASNFSVIDIATVLYSNRAPEDKIVWSCGWKAATIYYFLAEKGVIPKKALEEFPHEPYYALAETHVSGVYCNSGSVGHGASIAVGLALGKKRAGEGGMIYCVLSDGDLNEGATWEAFLFAGHHKLSNLTFVIDVNGFQAMGATDGILNIRPMGKKLNSFHIATEVVDGHNYTEIEDALYGGNVIQPRAFICLTTKGKGVSFMENSNDWHYKNLSETDYYKALRELDDETT